MGNNISLTPELEQYAKSKVDEGLYGSMSELMRDALRLLRHNDIEYQQQLQRELEKAEKDIEEGRVMPLDIQAIIDECNSELP